MVVSDDNFSFSLGDLADPNQHIDAIDMSGLSQSDAKSCLRQMIVIRKAEEKIGDKVTAGEIACPCHLAIGQEAVAVGVSLALRKTDRVFGGHRSHAHYLATGGDLYALFAEVLGKESGCSKGMGGSMHLFSKNTGFYGSAPIVGGTVPLAVGAGLAAQLDKNGDVGVTYFGDGAAEEGAIHESLNFASIFKLPVLFVCENNLFSSHLHIDLRQPANSVARFGQAHRMKTLVVDGNDVNAVFRATTEILKGARAGEGPGFLEAVTYRWRGHVGPREDIDVGVKRKDDLHLWKQRDPIKRLRDAMISGGFLTSEDYEKISQGVQQEIEALWSLAANSPYPPPQATLDCVYAGHTP